MNEEDQPSNGDRLTQMSSRLVQIRDQKRGLKKQLEDLEAEKDLISIALKELMDQMGVQNVKIPNVGTVFLATTFYVKANPERVEELVRWLDEHQLGALAKRSVHYQTLRSEYCRWMDQDLPVPSQDLVSAQPVTEVRVRKAAGTGDKDHDE